MGVANRLTNYLSVSQTPYRVVHHKLTQSASDSAHAAHLSTSSVVKSVLLRDRENGRYLVALTPACNRLELGWVHTREAPHPVLAREAELGEVFPDCAFGAVPGFGQAYHLDMVWDENLADQASLYFESGNHEDLIEIEGHHFHQLFDSFPHAHISVPYERYEAYHSVEFRGGLH
jgi:Ala-tRNA(Pro) deacylase